MSTVVPAWRCCHFLLAYIQASFFSFFADLPRFPDQYFSLALYCLFRLASVSTYNPSQSFVDEVLKSLGLWCCI